jgi:ring-1,2-phenylacetyl-CoA epoxidase subunit PaaE
MRFHELTVAEVRRETPEAVSIRFTAPPELEETFRFQAGQYVAVAADIAGEEVIRNYSLCAPPSAGELRVAVKEIAGGAFSTFVNRRLQAGDRLKVAPPMGRFTWPFDPRRSGRYLAFAGGSGVTPILSLIATALETEPHSRFTLAYGNKNAASIIFLEALAALKDRHLDRLQVLHILEEEEEEIALFNGRLDEAKCAELFGRAIRLEGLTAAFICGPGPMMDAVEAALRAAGVPEDKILIERFTAGAPSAAAAAAARALTEQAKGLELTVIMDGRRRRIPFDAEKGSILDSARAAGLPAPFACKGGVCATCRARVLQGRVAMKANYALTPEEVAKGYILTCQAVPQGEGVVVAYES